MKKQLYLIDAMAFAFRAYHAIRTPLSDAQNRPTNAVFGFTRILLKLLREHDPPYIAVVFDAPEKNFREEMYPEYKATRAKTPPELIEQIPRMHEVARALNLPVLVEPGVEADDVIGTLARQAESAGFEVVIVSSDKDLTQLISAAVQMYDPGKDNDEAWVRTDDVLARFGVGPENVRDVLALMGDASDNVPGVRGIGRVTARKLLSQHKSLENLYAHLDELADKLQKRLAEDRDQAFFSRDLITIKTDVPLELHIDDYARKPWDTEQLTECFEALSFHKLLEELVQKSAPEPIDAEYRCVTTRKTLDELMEAARSWDNPAIHILADDAQPMRAHVVGIALSPEKGKAWYVPVRHDAADLADLMEEPETPCAEFSGETALSLFKPLLEDEHYKKSIHDLKYAIMVLARDGVCLRGVAMDTMIASYLTDPSRLGHNIAELSSQYLNHTMIPIAEVIGKGSKSLTFDHAPLDKVTNYACEAADMVRRLDGAFTPLLNKDGLHDLFHDVELPLSHVLAKMEMFGIEIDGALFKTLQKELVADLEKLESIIQELAGETFNINSPKQLQAILFDKLGLKPARKTKSGYSTDIEVLETLATEHPLPRKIIEYRTLEKLRGTYVEALPRLVHPETKRIHTTFNQAVTATGRLSSSNPNLQNIPTRTELGKRIRRGFVAGGPERRLVAADYSQIELRILAHLSADKNLLKAFAADADIHRDTAARVFDVAPEQVTPEMRRQAKAVNFGVIYGISDFGLARNLGIAKSTAKKFIDQYFENYQGVMKWLSATKEQARRDGYVTTLMKRRRYIPDMNSSNAARRGAAERIAINTPVQGSAADIIKVAMIEVDEVLDAFDAHLLLQVHDELVVEVPAKHADTVAEKMKLIMEQAATLCTPLKIDIGIGTHWAEIH